MRHHVPLLWVYLKPLEVIRSMHYMYALELLSTQAPENEVLSRHHRTVPERRDGRAHCVK